MYQKSSPFIIDWRLDTNVTAYFSDFKFYSAVWIFFISLLIVFLKLIIPFSNFSDSLRFFCWPTLSLPLTSALLLAWLTSWSLPSVLTSLFLPPLLTSVLLLLFTSSWLPPLLTSLILPSLLPPPCFTSLLLSSFLGCISFSLTLSFLSNKLHFRLPPWVLLPLRSLPFVSVPTSKLSCFANLSFMNWSGFLLEPLRGKLLWLSNSGISGRGSVGGPSSVDGVWAKALGTLTAGSLVGSVLWKSNAGHAHAPWHPLLQYVVTGSSSSVSLLGGSSSTS